MARKTNLQKLCEDFGVTRVYIGELVKNQIIPAPGKRGAYDYRACIRGYVEHLRKQSGRLVDKEKRDLDLEERTEKIRGLRNKNNMIEKEIDDDLKRVDVSLPEVAEALDKIMMS